MTGSEAVQILREGRERLRREHRAGSSGLTVARGLSEATDGAIKSLWDRLAAQQGSAVIALGEYGRRGISPAAELDLLILHRPDLAPTEAANALSYELSGTGVECTLTVCTQEETLALAAERVDIETTLLDARFLAGETDLFKDLMQEALAGSGKSPDGFLERLREAVEARRLPNEDACAALEPNLKDGKGALADLATIRWIETICGPPELPVSQSELTDAEDLLHRVRNELQYCAGRNTDLLVLDYRQAVAEALAGQDFEEPAETRLMRRLYDRCRGVAFALDSILIRGSSDPEPARRFTRAFEGTPPGRRSTEWPSEARRSFLDILAAGPHGRDALRALDRSGVLVRAIPEWQAVRCLPEDRTYHLWAVDAHSFEMVAALAELSSDRDELIRVAAQEAAPKKDALLLAGLIHDIGKGVAGDHSKQGERLARTVVERIGLEEEAASDVTWLVRHHLLLSHTATRRDIGDEALIVELADRVGSQNRLGMLFLISVADALATGPAAWGMWKATLIKLLFTRVRSVLERGDLSGPNPSERARTRLEQLKADLSDLPPKQVEAHLSAMPRAWLLSQSVGALVGQSRQMIEFHPADEFRIRAAPLGDGLWEAVAIGRDRPGLFSKVSGALALHDLNVVGAEAFTRGDGVALEVFRLEALVEETERFERVATDVRKALRGRISFDARLAEKRRAAPASNAGGSPAHVVLDNSVSDFSTVVEVHATDRVGLLYTITRALAELELDISLAMVSTYGTDVVDVFYVADLDGQKAFDPEYLSEIEKTILHRLSTGS